MTLFNLKDGYFFFWLGLIAIVGLFSPYVYNYLPVVALLDLLIFLLVLRVVFLLGIPTKVVFFSLFLFLYLVLTFAYAFFVSSAHYLDYLQAYKAFFYFLLLSFFMGKSSSTVSILFLVSFFKFILLVFLIKYVYSLYFGFTPRMGERPGLFVENNFELVFLLIFFYLVQPFLKPRFLFFALVAFVVFISGSRSAMLSLIIVYFFTFIDRLDWRFFLAVVAAVPLTFFVLYGLMSRLDVGAGIESIDRFRFMLFFIEEVRDWPWWKFLFGSLPLTPLSQETCNSLQYYSSLFSYSGDGSCYSVIFHSYFLRVIFDHGLIGLAVLTFSLYWFMSAKGFLFRDYLCVLGVIYVSALSVSSFNSVFTIVSIILIMLSKGARGVQFTR